MLQKIKCKFDVNDMKWGNHTYRYQDVKIHPNKLLYYDGVALIIINRSERGNDFALGNQVVNFVQGKIDAKGNTKEAYVILRDNGSTIGEFPLHQIQYKLRGIRPRISDVGLSDYWWFSVDGNVIHGRNEPACCPACGQVIDESQRM